ncbi:hypothetical protein [Halorussus lipolyticus]|uniref:hypothetical protein n=1 Tax=Halorussus lipolyticus TaxID=3034024 RepID=UPI0023E7B0F6|nr:hypothetical protein [Halorussus sp. DT80]
MNLQTWINDNLYANSIPRRVAAFSLKFAFEIAVSSFLALFATIPIYYLITNTQFSIPAQVNSVFGLWIAFSTIIFNRAWCLLTKKESVATG